MGLSMFHLKKYSISFLDLIRASNLWEKVIDSLKEGGSKNCRPQKGEKFLYECTFAEERQREWER